MKTDNHQATISVAIATYNESENIVRCLDSIHDWVNEIIIVDGSPDDDTIKATKKYFKVKTIKTDNKPMFHLNKNMAIKACTSDWILQLDADEVVSLDLKNEIEKILKQEPTEISHNGFWVNRSNYFLGAFLKKGGQYPDPTIRFYKNGKGFLPCQDVHEQAEIDGEIGHLQSDLLHYADISFSRYLLRANRYTTLEANNLHTSGFNPGFLLWLKYFIFKPNYWFLATFFAIKALLTVFPDLCFPYFLPSDFPSSILKPGS